MVNHGSFPLLAESNGILADPTWFREAYGVMARVMEGSDEDTQYPAPSYTLMSIDAMAGEPAISDANVVTEGSQAANTTVDDRKAMVAVIEVRGMLSKNVPHWQPYMSNMLVLQRQLIAAANDPMVMGIVLLFDSGGGAVNGTTLLGDTIYQISRNMKPVYAHVQGLAASAAYWMASQCNGVYLSASTDFVGSIGVVHTHVSLEKAYEMEGIVVTYVTPDENDEKVIGAENQSLSDRDRELIKARLTPLLSEFKSSVARGRGDRCDITATGLASGNVFMASQAKRMGLADGIESLERTVLRAYREGVKFSKQREKAENSNDDDMTITEQLRLGLTTPAKIKGDADAQSAQANAQAQTTPAAETENGDVTMKDLLKAINAQNALFTQILAQNAPSPASESDTPAESADTASAEEVAAADVEQAEESAEVAADVETGESETGAVTEASETSEEAESASVTETDPSPASEEDPADPQPEADALAAFREEMAQLRTEMTNMASQLREAATAKAEAEARATQAEEKAKKAQDAFNSRKKAPSVAAANAEADRGGTPEAQPTKQLDTETAGFSSQFKTNGVTLGEKAWSRSSE